MSASQRLPSPFAALSDKELEVLRMLTSGHTVKSIATRLGRSEASINERLRDARRKTGIGSSRELARLLDAQKIWDKNIDLSKQDFAADRAVRSPNPGARSSKGIRTMLFAMPIAAAGLMFAATDSMQLALPEQTVHAAPHRQQPLPETGRSTSCGFPSKSARAG